MTVYNLSLSDVVAVSVLSAPSALGMPNLNTIALFTHEQPVSPFSGDYKLYRSATDVAADFAVGAEAIEHANAIFGQNPNIMTTNGYLVIVPMKTVDAVLETVEEAIKRVVNQIYFGGITTTEAITAGSPAASLLAYVQTLDKVMALTFATAADIEPNGFLDEVRQASQTHIRCIYYSVSDLAARVMGSAYLSRGLSTDFTGSNTTSTMHLKSLVGQTADPTMDETTLAKAQAAGVDVYGSIGGIAQLFTSGANGWFDDVYNSLWFKLAIQIAGYNYLRQTNYKIPQTEKGIIGLKGNYNSVCAQAVSNAYCAPGSWTSPDTFGDKDDFLRNITDFGYYIYSAPISEQLPADRSARKSPLVQIALKTAGAVHSGIIIVNVNA